MFITEFSLKLDPPSLRSGLGMVIVATPRQLTPSPYKVTPSMFLQLSRTSPRPNSWDRSLRLFQTFGVDLSMSPGCGCRRPSACVGPVGIEPTLTRCKYIG